MEKIIVLVIVTIAALFIVRNFYGKLKKEGNSACGCACESSKNTRCRTMRGENTCACPESCDTGKSPDNS